MSKLNRRSLMQGAIAAGAAGAITIVAARQGRANEAAPALRGLCDDVHRLCREILAADARLATAVDRAREAWPVADETIRYRAGGAPRHPCPVTGGAGFECGKRQAYYVWTSGECDGYLADLRRPSKARTEWQDMRALALAYEAACLDVRARFRVDELAAELQAVGAARDAAIEAVAAAPVANVAELALKASALSAAPPFVLMMNASRLAKDAIALGGTDSA